MVAMAPGETVFGPFAVGTQTELAGKNVELVAGFDLGFDFATDGTLILSDRTFARLLGYENQERLLQETLDEEGEADKALTDLAETMVNPDAEVADEEEEEEEKPKPRGRKAAAGKR